MRNGKEDGMKSRKQAHHGGRNWRQPRVKDSTTLTAFGRNQQPGVPRTDKSRGPIQNQIRTTDGLPPALTVSSAASVSSLSQQGCPSNHSVHYSESNAVKEYIRTDIYKHKKTIFV